MNTRHLSSKVDARVGGNLIGRDCRVRAQIVNEAFHIFNVFLNELIHLVHERFFRTEAAQVAQVLKCLRDQRHFTGN